MFALRFRAYGRRHYVTLGSKAEGWTQARAEDELDAVLDAVSRGVWAPTERVGRRDPLFEAFVWEWWATKHLEFVPHTRAAYKSELRNHLIPFFGHHRLSQITAREVDRYRAHKLEEGRISPAYINTTLTRLGQVLDVAIDYGLINHNPARGRRRRLKVLRTPSVYLDSVEQIVAMLDAATELDARTAARTKGRRALIATLMFAGLRSNEVCALSWRDVDLTGRRITVREAKTPAGAREIELLPLLYDELVAYRDACAPVQVDDPVFTTATGRRRTKDNLRQRVMVPVVQRADELLIARGQQPLAPGITAHKLRHTFASILIACGEDPAHVMRQLGHTDPHLTLRVYTHEMSRRPGERARLEALVEHGERAPSGTRSGPSTATNRRDPHGRGWFRTTDLSRVKRALSH
jgi:integrase